MDYSVYSLHPSFARMQSFESNVVAATGKTLDEWLKIVKRDGPEDPKKRMLWLKTAHGLGLNYAGWISERSTGGGTVDAYDPVGMVDAMFSGAKSALRPIYERLLELGLSIAPDVMACPCSTIVPLFRKHVFAQLKPASNARIDVGYALRDLPAAGRLIDTGGFAKGDRISHRIPVTSMAEIDDEVVHWMKRAYYAAAPGK